MSRSASGRCRPRERSGSSCAPPPGSPSRSRFGACASSSPASSPPRAGCSGGALPLLQPAVELVRRLGESFAAAREQRGGDVLEVALGVVLGERQRGQRADAVGPRRQQPHEQRGGGAVVL